MDSTDRRPVARPAGSIWSMEFRLCAIPSLGETRSPGETVPAAGVRIPGPGRRDGGRYVREGTPARGGFPKRNRPPGGEAIGRSKGGLTTKILAATDRRGNLIRYLLLPGNAAESPGLVPLTDGIATKGSAVIADKAYDTDKIRKTLAAQGIISVIPSKSNRKHPFPLDKAQYRTRHLVENYFARIKEYRRIATRYDKTDTSYSGMLDLVATVIAMR